MSTVPPQKVRLTETVKKGGCAAKLPAGELRKVLGGLHLPQPPELLVGTEWLDDAALWDLGDGRCLVQTLDFFTPIVDDPYEFGMIAAANSISDVYAMGGIPKTVMSILAFPTATLPTEILEPLLRGALDKIKEAGAALVGGHTIDDDTLKLGFSVTGFVDKNRAWANTTAKPGDVLILTKALGTGTLSSALKSRVGEVAWFQGAIQSMATLNRAPEILGELCQHVRAATDITGFGLAGHTLQMAKASRVAVDFEFSQLPLLEGAQACLAELKVLNRAHKTNWDYVQNDISGLEGRPDWQRHILTDAQTSGGLLLSVDPKFQNAVLDCLKPQFAATQTIGKVVEASGRPCPLNIL